MKKTNFKLFTMFLAGIAFSALTVFAATISISTNFEDGAIQYLKKLVILMDNNNTGIILDGSNSKIMSNNICDKDGNNCKIVSQLITGSALNSYLTGTRSFLTGEDTKWCIMSAGKISCFENAPSGGGTSLWSTGTSERIYYNSGNVGIGTNTPAYKFTVNGTGYFENGLYVNGVIGPEDNGDDLRFLADGYLFKNGGGEDKLVINSQGYVGIGTNPTEKLEVIGTGKFGDRLYFSSFGAIGSYITANGTRPLNFIVNGINTMTMNYQGYVGIGTGTPQSMLHVNGTIQAGDNLKTYTSVYGIIESNNQLRFNTNGNNTRMTIDNNGNVGIGTGTPQAKFHITKPVWGDGGNQYLIKASLDNSSNNRFWIHDGGDAYVDGWLGIGINPLEAQGNTQKHALLVNGTSYLSGNVGIGKNPSYKLDVAGTGYFEKGLIVDGTAQIGNNLKLKTVGDHGAIYSNNNLYLYVSGSTQAVVIDTDKNMDVEGDVTATAFYYDSDERLKTDISTIVNPLQKILSLSGYNFTWIKDGRQDIGVIAQEVEKVFPEIVQTNAEGYKSVEYGNLVAPLIEAIKELNAKIDRQAQEIAILKASIQ